MGISWEEARRWFKVPHLQNGSSVHIPREQSAELEPGLIFKQERVVVTSGDTVWTTDRMAASEPGKKQHNRKQLKGCQRSRCGTYTQCNTCCSVTQLYLTLCDPMDCSTPGFPVLHHLPELAQTHVRWVGDAIQPSHLLSSSSPAFNLSQHQGLF